MALIQVRNLRKEFKLPMQKNGRFSAVRTLFNTQYTTKVAVQDISFSIEKGEVVGYVGPNGAGKSTTIKMLTGILAPTAGTVEVAGLIPQKQRQKHVRHIGVVFGQKTQLWWDVPVIDSLNLLKEVYSIPTEVYQMNLKIFQEILGLHEFQQTPARQLSLGQRMRADLAAALLHNPDILFLDEPTIGMDVLAKSHFREFVIQINRELHTTILLTTHDMSDIEQVCQRIIMIDKGQLIYDGSLVEMKRHFVPFHILRIELDKSLDLEAQPDISIPGINNELIQVETADASTLRLRFDRQRLSASELIASVVKQYVVKDIHIEEPTIETIVRGIYEKQ